MGIIAEFTVRTPLLAPTMNAVPEMTIEMEDLQLMDEGPVKFFFWASGGDVDTFESALEDDGSVANFVFLTRVSGRALYRVTFAEGTREQMVYPTAMENDIIYLSLTQTHEGSRIQAQVGTRDALGSYRDACADRDMPFHLHRLYEEEGDNTYTLYGLTEPQYEALMLAYNAGYFGATRDANLEEIAEQIGISPQALAGRLRRGLENLIENSFV